MRSLSKPLIPLNAAKLLFFFLFHKNLRNYFNKKGILLPFLLMKRINIIKKTSSVPQLCQHHKLITSYLLH
jgi:hypothetical protein